MRAVSQEIPQPLTTKISLKITHLKFTPRGQWVNISNSTTVSLISKRSIYFRDVKSTSLHPKLQTTELFFFQHDVQVDTIENIKIPDNWSTSDRWIPLTKGLASRKKSSMSWHHNVYHVLCWLIDTGISAHAFSLHVHICLLSPQIAVAALNGSFRKHYLTTIVWRFKKIWKCLQIKIDFAGLSLLMIFNGIISPPFH